MKTSRHVRQLVLWALAVSNCVCKVMWRFLVQRYIFHVTFAIVDVIFPATFNYFNAFFPVKMCDANIFTEGVRKSKNQPFSIFFLKTADFYHTIVCQILAIDKGIDEILHLQAKIIIRYARKKSHPVSHDRG